MQFEHRSDRVIDTEEGGGSNKETEKSESESEMRSGSLNIVAPSEDSSKGVLSIKIIESAGGTDHLLPALPDLLESRERGQEGVKNEGVSQTEKVLNTSNKEAELDRRENGSVPNISNTGVSLPVQDGLLETKHAPCTPKKPE